MGWDNVWLGTSVGGEGGLSRILALLAAPKAKVKFLSLEPLHDFISITTIPEFINAGYTRVTNALTGTIQEWEEYYGEISDGGIIQGDKIDWVIVGGESGNESGKYRYRPCEFEWIEKIVFDCKEAGVPVFVKQMGTYLAKRHGLGDRHGTLMEHWPPSLQVREFPKGKEVVHA